MLVVLYCTVVFIAFRLVIYINRNLLAPSKAAYSHNKSYSSHNRLVRAMLHFSRVMRQGRQLRVSFSANDFATITAYSLAPGLHRA